ncbi:MAG: hydantoinase/oxoprolinase N-terminal domain-containing protein, partial [Acidobacteriota bacterium]
MKTGKRWRIWIDTGGTFTDCVALDPDDRFHRCKVLSSSSLRDTVVAVEGDRIQLAGGSLLPDDFLTGMELSPLGAARCVVILEHDGKAGTVRLDGSPIQDLRPHLPVELRSPEAAPLLAARLVTATPLHCGLPPLRMRLATTRAT